MDAEPGSTAAPHAPAQALFPVSGVALFPFPSAMLALPAGTEAQAAASDWTRMSSFCAAVPAVPAPCAAPPSAPTAQPGSPSCSSGSEAARRAAASEGERRKKRRAEDATRKELKRYVVHPVVLPFGSAHAPPPSAKRSDAAKVAQLEAALGSSRSDAGCRAAAAAAYAPGVAYWFDAQPDWGNVSYQGADRGAAPRFTRFRSTLLAAREGGEGGAPAGLGRRRGYPGAGLDSAPTDPTAGATQGRAAAAAAAAAAASQRSCCAALPPSRLRRLLPQPSLAAEACTSAPAPAERLRVPDPDAADAAQSSEAHAQRLGAQLQCAARERPYDVAVWLRLAAFQEEQLRSAAAAAASRSRRAEAQQRRVLTLEQALGHHPGSESLTLMLLRACAQAGDAQPEMDARWEAALAEAPGGGRLWTAAVARAAAHSPLSAAVLAQRAVEALTRERARRAEGGAACAELDAALCDVALAAVAADVHAGWEERGLAKLQAVVEFACFGPSWDEDEMGEAKQRNRRTQGRGDAAAQRLRAFLRFWASEAPRWGETGAKGWAAWCAEQQLGGYEPAAPLPPPRPPPPPPTHVPPDEDVPAGGAIAQEGDEQEDGEQRDGGEAADAADEEESDEALLCRLGITLDAEVLTSSMSGEALCEWLQEEAARDAQGWRPLRAADVRSRSDAALLVDAAEVQEGGLLFELGSEEARAELLLKALALLGSCDDGDCASPRELLMAHLPRCGSAAAWRAGEGGRGGWTAEAAVQAALRFPRHPRMCTAALQAHSGTGEAREAAKRLLAAKRGSLPLWAAFAGHEAAAGRVAHARKAFHGALALAQQAAAAQAQQASVLSAALEGGGGGAAAGTDGACGAAPALADVPALVLRYAEFEAAHGACEAARDALARLGCCFCGGGTSLLPGEGAPPSELHAQRGFQAALCAVAAQPAEALPGACALWVLFAAALYAELTDRPQAAASMLVRAAPASPQAHARALGTLLGPRAACAPPRLASEAFASALRLFPASPQVLALLASAPARAKLSSHALRRMADGASAAGGGEQALWAALALEAAFCSDGGGGGGGGAHSPPLASPRARALLSRAAMSPELAALPLLWRCRLLAASSAAGGPAAATRRAFFRAAAAAPACKALWLQGLGACNARDGALSDAERAQLLDAAQREGRLRLRADAYELALQRQARGLLDQ